MVGTGVIKAILVEVVKSRELVLARIDGPVVPTHCVYGEPDIVDCSHLLNQHVERFSTQISVLEGASVHGDLWTSSAIVASAQVDHNVGPDAVTEESRQGQCQHSRGAQSLRHLWILITLVYTGICACCRSSFSPPLDFDVDESGRRAPKLAYFQSNCVRTVRAFIGYCHLVATPSIISVLAATNK
ncbi:hypothetical protein BCV70DRAFT_37860 [Testicularia cyperi]|uniref:Uncharacterized protein n=1 Tax=Testicularia cyperi TaxID=1882483 RepID=A0A317XJ61_9BASI|nr:hypothetical protein BCV70DRAFT_37860 [Testicularia cyperi]